MNKEYTNPKGFRIARTDTIIDIGAHKGVFSLYAGCLAKEGRVFSYEPHPSNYSFLQENLARNNAANTRAFNLAVWSEPGKTTLKISSSSLSHSLVLQTDSLDTVEVPCTGLREIFEENRIGRCEFLKIDAEGAEYEILRATPVQTLARTDRIVAEVHTVPGWSMTRLCDLLTERGFKTTLHGRLVFATRS
jgi:FkbM family methyltransferase